MILAIIVAAEAEAKDQIQAQFHPLWEKFGEKSTTKLKIVAGPEDVKMRNGGVAGKRWIATGGDYRFKLTIETVTGVTLDTSVKCIEQFPASYMKACVAVSDEGEDGIAVYLPDYFRCSDCYHDHPDFHYYRYGIRVTGNPGP